MPWKREWPRLRKLVEKLRKAVAWLVAFLVEHKDIIFIILGVIGSIVSLIITILMM